MVYHAKLLLHVTRHSSGGAGRTGEHVPHRTIRQLYTHIKEMLSGILDDPEGTLTPEQRTIGTLPTAYKTLM